jgi:hypothetical protein
VRSDMRKRITLLIAALMLALTMAFGSVAAFAKATQTDVPCGLAQGGFDPSGHLVITDSGNANLSCHVNAQ